MPTGRFEDAHDVLGTFELIDDPTKRGRVPADGTEFVERLRADHAVILGNRPAAVRDDSRNAPTGRAGRALSTPTSSTAP